MLIRIMSHEDFDPENRAREKEASREADSSDLASGSKSSEQLCKENGLFAFGPGRIRLLLSNSIRLV